MNTFPQLKAQEQIDREDRRARWISTAWECLGCVALVAALFSGYILGAQ